MSWRTIRSFGVVCSGWMAMALPALADPRGDPAPAGGEQHLWTCDESAQVVEFRTSSARLSREARAELREIAVWAKDDAARSVRLRGMTDRSGTARGNAKLSERRANAVKSYLTTQGVDPMRVTTVGHTDDELKDDVDNRRAVAVVTCTVSPMAQAPAPPLAPVVVAEAPPLDVPPPPPPLAAPAEPPPMELPASMPDSPPVETRQSPVSGIGIGAMVGGGVTGFYDKQARAFTGAGPSWDARITVGTRMPIAFEGAYTGSAQNISALGINDNALIVGHGAEGALRFNLTRMAIQPFLFGGLGWTRYDLRRTPENTSSLRRSDDILTVPFGAGITARVARGLLLELRATGRAAFHDDLMDAAYANTGEDARLHSWNAGGRLGWEL
jgi:hypothetical protein